MGRHKAGNDHIGMDMPEILEDISILTHTDVTHNQECCQIDLVDLRVVPQEGTQSLFSLSSPMNPITSEASLT